MRDDPWFREGRAGKSNALHDAFKIVGDDGKLVRADQKAFDYRIPTDKQHFNQEKAQRFAEVEKNLKASNRANSSSDFNKQSLDSNFGKLEGRSDKFSLAMLAVSIGGALKAAYDSPAEAEKTMQLVQQHMNAESLSEGAWLVTSSLAYDAATYMAVRAAAGPVGTLTLVALDVYSAARDAIKSLKTAFPEQWIWGWMDSHLDRMESFIQTQGRALAEFLTEMLRFTELYLIGFWITKQDLEKLNFDNVVAWEDLW